MKHSLRGRFPVRPALSPAMESRKDRLIEVFAPKLFSWRANLESQGMPRADLIAVIFDEHPTSALSEIVVGVEPSSSLGEIVRIGDLSKVIEVSRSVATRNVLPLLYITRGVYSVDAVSDGRTKRINSMGGMA